MNLCTAGNSGLPVFPFLPALPASFHHSPFHSFSSIATYTYGPGIDNLIAMTVHSSTTNQTFYTITDPLGTVHALVDATGAVMKRYTYDAWGNIQKSEASQHAVDNRFLFQGREYSVATGLYNFRARWYDPQTGRWLSNDPIGISGGMNLYAFCGNNPVMYRDPEGLCEDDSWLDSICDIGGKLWSIPNTIVGLSWGLSGIPFGGSWPTIGNNAIHFENHPGMMDSGAITFGNVIAYGKNFPPQTRIPEGTSENMKPHTQGKVKFLAHSIYQQILLEAGLDSF